MNPMQRGQRIGIALFSLSTELHDRLNAPILRTDHLEHALVLRRSFEECGKIFVIGVLYNSGVSAIPVIDCFMNERGH